MIKRSDLAEQLREYQIRSKHDWASTSFFSSTSNISSSRRPPQPPGGQSKQSVVISIGIRSLKAFAQGTRSLVDVVAFVIWELVILAFLVFSALSLYFRHFRLAVFLACVMLLLFLFMKITKQVRLARKKRPRMLLPLSM